MVDRPILTLWGVVLGTPNPRALASFYERLLGYERHSDDEDWTTSLSSQGDRPGLSFQLEDPYRPPGWPAGEGDQHMQMHLDISVENLAAAGEFALSLGARLADFQPQDDVRVYLDPDGHPFCFFVD